MGFFLYEENGVSPDLFQSLVTPTWLWEVTAKPTTKMTWAKPRQDLRTEYTKLQGSSLQRKKFWLQKNTLLWITACSEMKLRNWIHQVVKEFSYDQLQDSTKQEKTRTGQQSRTQAMSTQAADGREHIEANTAPGEAPPGRVAGHQIAEYSIVWRIGV